MAVDLKRVRVGDVISYVGPAYESYELWRGKIMEVRPDSVEYRATINRYGETESGGSYWMKDSRLEDFTVVSAFDLEKAEAMKKTNLRPASEYMKEMNHGS